MKKQILAGLLALSLSLTGCASLLERQHSVVSPHSTAPTTEGDPSTLRAESYQELVNALLYFVTSGARSGVIRLYLDGEDVPRDLEDACLEVVNEDPLGAYAVDVINYDVTSVVTYYEAQFQITYRRTPEQVNSIVSATGITAIRSQLEAAMDAFEPECVLRASYFNEDEAFIHTLARQAYLQNPTGALGYPDITVSLYPSTGRQRIVEVILQYDQEPAVLEEKRAVLKGQLQRMAFSPSTPEETSTLLRTVNAVCAALTYDPEGPSLPGDALSSGTADAEGLAMVFSALCEVSSLPCRVVEGSRDGSPHFWNLVETDAGWRHLDLSAPDREETVFFTDQEMTDLGFFWNSSFYPQTGVKSPE